MGGSGKQARGGAGPCLGQALLWQLFRLPPRGWIDKYLLLFSPGACRVLDPWEAGLFGHFTEREPEDLGTEGP